MGARRFVETEERVVGVVVTSGKLFRCKVVLAVQPKSVAKNIA